MADFDIDNYMDLDAYYLDDETNVLVKDNINLNLKLKGHLKCNPSGLNSSCESLGANSDPFFDDSSYDDPVVTAQSVLSMDDVPNVAADATATSPIIITPLDAQFTGFDNFFFDENNFFRVERDCIYNFPNKDLIDNDTLLDCGYSDSVSEVSDDLRHDWLSECDDTNECSDKCGSPDKIHNNNDTKEIPPLKHKPKCDNLRSSEPVPSPSPTLPPTIGALVKHTYGAKLKQPCSLQCFHCDTIFKTYTLLVDHYEKFNLYKNLKYKCPLNLCPFHLIGFNKKLVVRKHIVSQHFNKKTQKLSCKSSFDEANLISQMIYTCKTCRKVFYRKDSLQRHYRLIHKT